MNKPLVIDYYSDILCVWAWIAQRRIDELKQTFGAALEFRYRYVDIFGDTQTK
ncbi:MAG: DsbA family protein [Candidatus Reddybacter sp.]